MREVEIKGWRNGLVIVLPEDGANEELQDRLQVRLSAAKDGRTFWRGAQVTLDLGNRLMSGPELVALCDWLRAEFGLVPLAAVATHPETRAAAERLVLKVYDVLPIVHKATADWSTTPAEREPVVEEPIATNTASSSQPLLPPSSDSDSNALYLYETLRTGRRIVHAGNLVICGNVNSGAEIYASGDILVFGKLRGVAWAGKDGDESARIVALELKPTQLRIAGRIAAAPQDDGRRTIAPLQPEVARIENGEIHVFPL